MQDRGIHQSRLLSIAVILWVLIWSIFIAHPPAVQASEDFPTKPMLRLETGMHTAPIRRIDADRGERFLVSGSHDKTVRIWELQSGRLLRTLRVPLGEGDLGKVYCVAISPDGSSVAVGGWTGSASGTNNDIYIYDRQSGELRQVIGGLPNVIRHLRFSPDGRYLAATLGGSNGLRVYETAAYKQTAADPDYGDSSYWADFDANGRLVTTCYDGHIRLYGSNFKLIQKKKAPGGNRPFGTAFSPDGRRIAVGYLDSTRVDVLSADSLDLAFSADTADAKNGDLSSVAWSPDGHFLYAAGRYNVGGLYPIRRWPRPAGGVSPSSSWPRIPSGPQGPFKRQTGRRGGGPVLAVLSADGKSLWQQAGEIADFRGQRGENAIRLSRTGDHGAVRLRAVGQAAGALFA